MLIKKLLSIFVLVALIPLTANAAFLDQSVFNHVTLISDIRNSQGSGQSFLAETTGLLTGIDVRITTQDQLVGHINLYVNIFGTGIFSLDSPHIEIDAGLIPEGGYVNDPTPGSLLSIDVSPLNFYVESGQQYSFFAVGAFASDDVRALLELGCFNNTEYQCESPTTIDSYESGQRLVGYLENPGDTSVQYQSFEGSDANFRTWIEASDVPAPATQWLIGLALLVLGLMMHQKPLPIAKRIQSSPY